MAEDTKQQFVQINFDGIKYVTHESHSIVFGYIHQHQKKMMEVVIPSPIYFLCLMYYYIHNLFDPVKHSSHVTITGDYNETITREDSGPAWAVRCAYGNHWMESISNKLIKYKIKINEIVTDRYQDQDSLIGISSNDTYLDKPFAVVDNIFYAFDHDGYKWCLDTHDDVPVGKAYGRAWNTGDVITIELNCLTCTLSFYVNDEYQGIAFDDIKTGKEI